MGARPWLSVAWASSSAGNAFALSVKRAICGAALATSSELKSGECLIGYARRRVLADGARSSALGGGQVEIERDAVAPSFQTRH